MRSAEPGHYPEVQSRHHRPCGQPDYPLDYDHEADHVPDSGLLVGDFRCPSIVSNSISHVVGLE